MEIPNNSHKTNRILHGMAHGYIMFKNFRWNLHGFFQKNWRGYCCHLNHDLLAWQSSIHVGKENSHDFL